MAECISLAAVQGRAGEGGGVGQANLVCVLRTPWPAACAKQATAAVIIQPLCVRCVWDDKCLASEDYSMPYPPTQSTHPVGNSRAPVLAMVLPGLV